MQIVVMTQLLLLASLFHTSHRTLFVKEIAIELDIAAAKIGDYQHNPPVMIFASANAFYVMRAEADISAATFELKKYKHHRAAEEDVRTAVSQLARDLANIPPAHWPVDFRVRI